MFFTTYVYCDTSPSLMDWPLLSVVVFVDEQNTAHLHVYISQKNATTDEFQSANRVSFRTANWSCDKPNKNCF